MTQQGAPSAGTRATRGALIVPLALAAVLAGAAVVTVERVACDEPGRYVTTSQGVELVGGCLAPGDLPFHPVTGHDSEDDAAARRG